MTSEWIFIGLAADRLVQAVEDAKGHISQRSYEAIVRVAHQAQDTIQFNKEYDLEQVANERA